MAGLKYRWKIAPKKSYSCSLIAAPQVQTYTFDCAPGPSAEHELVAVSRVSVFFPPYTHHVPASRRPLAVIDGITPHDGHADLNPRPGK